jgi:hypothetical protein
MRTSIRHLLGAHVAACLALGNTLPVLGATRADTEPARPAPGVLNATVQLLERPGAAGNAVLRVQFVDRRSRGSLSIDAGPGPALLRDDGVAPDSAAADGVYAAIVQVDAAQFAREQQRRIGLAQTVKKSPVFVLRELQGEEPLTLSGEVELSTRKPLRLDRFLGVPGAVDAPSSLFITAVKVVEDPQRTYDPCTQQGTRLGAWTFGRLMTEIANQPLTGIDPALMAEHWMGQFLNDQSVNGFTVPAHTMAPNLVLQGWSRLPDGRLDLSRAPFRLLAIVNRQDLRSSVIYGGENAGEARLVFGALRCATPQNPAARDDLAFTVIFEYGIKRRGCAGVRDWARQWRDLADVPLGSPAYNTALQAITDQFTLRNAAPERLNGSAIHQVRSNETSFLFMPGEDGWELRESVLTKGGPTGGLLENATVAQSPASTLKAGNQIGVVRDFIDLNAASILAGTHEVPLQFPAGTPFRGGVDDPGSPSAWKPPGLMTPSARHPFALATCGGCHTLETGSTFVHVFPRQAGVASKLSDFLTGADMPKHDPATQQPRHFNELLKRRMALDATANMACTKHGQAALDDLFFQVVPRAFVH